MTPAEHERVFFEFVKNHPVFSNLKFSEQKVDQEIIGVLVHDDTAEGRELPTYIPYYLDELYKLEDSESVIIDPNYDTLYQSFIEQDHDLESIEYMKSLVESKTTREELTEIAIELIVKPLIASNIDAKKVYIVIHSHWAKDWLDKVIEI